MRIEHALGVAGGAGGKTHGGGIVLAGTRKFVAATGGRQQFLISFRAGRQGPVLMTDDKNSIRLYLVTEPLIQRQQHVIDDEKTVLRVIDDESQLLRVQPKIERVHHAAGGGHAEVGFKMGVVVPAESAYAVSGLQPGAMQRFSKRLGAAVKIHIRVTVQAAIREAGDDLNRRVSFGDSLQDGLEAKGIIHHGSLHRKRLPEWLI